MRRRREERSGQYTAETYVDLVTRLAANVRRLRRQRRWTLEEAAANSGIALQHLQRVEAARANITMTTLARLCDGLDVDPRILLRPTRKAPASSRSRGND